MLCLPNSRFYSMYQSVLMGLRMGCADMSSWTSIFNLRIGFTDVFVLLCLWYILVYQILRQYLCCGQVLFPHCKMSEKHQKRPLHWVDVKVFYTWPTDSRWKARFSSETLEFVSRDDEYLCKMPLLSVVLGLHYSTVTIILNIMTFEILEKNVSKTK